MMGHEMPVIGTVSWSLGVEIKIPHSVYLSVRTVLAFSMYLLVIGHVL